MVKKVPLTKGRFALVDDDDYDFLTQRKWKVDRAGYVLREQSKTIDGKRHYKCFLMHRVVNQTPAGLETDHINGDKFDNRKENLRTVTPHQNQANSPKKGKHNKYKGVHKRGDKFSAQIVKDRKCHYLGLFSNETDAAIRYNAAAIELFGVYARLNEIEVIK